MPATTRSRSAGPTHATAVAGAAPSTPRCRPAFPAMASPATRSRPDRWSSWSRKPRRLRPGCRPASNPRCLERLARAAGIAPDWSDVEGARACRRRRHAPRAAGSDGTRCGDHRPGPCAARGTCGAARSSPAAAHAGRAGKARSRTIPLAAGAPASLHRGAFTNLPRGRGDAIAFRSSTDEMPGDSIAAIDGGTRSPPIRDAAAASRRRAAVAFDGRTESACRLVVAPRRCHLPDVLRRGGRRFGLAAHLYALRRRGDQGIGDFTTLREAARPRRARAGVIVGLNPLHALFAASRDRASPYHPSDRRFLDPIYIDVERVPDLEASPDARRVLATHAGALAQPRRAARRGLHGRLGREALGAGRVASTRSSGAVGTTVSSAEFDRFVARGGVELQRYAAFEAIAAAHPQASWPDWPAALRQPDGPAVTLFAQRHARDVRFACYLQWLADRQFGDAAAGSRASRARLRILPRSRRRRRARRGRGLVDPGHARARRFDRRAAGSVFTSRAGMASAAGDSRCADRGWLRHVSLARPRQHPARRRAAHRPRHGSLSSVLDSGGCNRRGGRLRPLSDGRSPRRARAGKHARAMP